MASIYTITTYRRTADRKVGNKLWHDRRTVGWLSDLAVAIRVVEHNGGDLEEAGWYRWAVIDEIPEGLYGIGDGRKMDPLWFEYAGDDRWVRIDVSPHRCPAEIKEALGTDRILNWSEIG